MIPSPIPYITPMMSVPGPLIQAIAASGSYRLAAERLLDQAWSLDAHLCPAFEAIPVERGADYFLNLKRLDWNRSREIFVAIRRKKNEVDSRYPLLGHAAEIVDYVSHMTTNIFAMRDPGRNLLASAPNSGIAVTYKGFKEFPFCWSLALHMGLSPFPIFGTNIFYEEEAVASSLAGFGLGTLLYLTLALHPELARDGLSPPETVRDGVPRPVSQRPLEIRSDGSIVLKN
jgi:hypothetical protein